MQDIKGVFAEQGYYVARGVFSPDEVRELETDFDRIIAQLTAGKEQINARWGGPEMERLGAKDTVVLHTHNVQQYSAVWMRALLQPRFLDVAEAILGPDIVLHHTKLFQKPPEKGAPFPMHQDWTYFPTENDTMMAGIIHVSNATDEMGCFRLYPGSHKLGKLEGTSGQLPHDVLAQYPLENSTPVEAQPGDVLFFHYFLLHGSKPNRSKQTRKTVLVQMHEGHDTVEERGLGHPYERLVVRGWNYRASRSTANRGKPVVILPGRP